MSLQYYDLEIQFKRGKLLVIADTLSRNYIETAETVKLTEEENEI